MRKEQVDTTANPEESGIPKPPRDGKRKGRGRDPHRRSNGRNNGRGGNGHTR